MRIDSNQIRYSLGFTHPNTLAAFIMIICFEWLYLRYNKMKYFDYLGIITVMGIVNEITDSRSSFYIVIFMLILSIYFKVFHDKFEKKRILKVFIKYIVLINAIISILISINYNHYNEIMFKINDIFSGRIYQANWFINKYGFSIVGQTVNMVSFRTSLAENIKSVILDNGYIYIAIVYGIIPLFLFCIGYIKLLKWLIREKNYSLIICIVLLAIYGLMETYIFKMSYNFTIISIAYIWRNNEIKENNKVIDI